MGIYCVRFKGAKVKGAKVPKSRTPVEDEDGGEEVTNEEAEVAEMPGMKKMKMATPEKEVVAAILGVAPKPKAKKKEFPARAIIGTKGSAKSGNYAHRGIPGHVGGSAPKGGAVTGTGGAAIPKLTGEWTPKQVDDALAKNARLMKNASAITNRDERIARTNDLEKQRAQLEDKKAELAKAGYIAAHPESVAAHQAAGKPITVDNNGNITSHMSGWSKYPGGSSGRSVDSPDGKVEVVLGAEMHSGRAFFRAHVYPDAAMPKDTVDKWVKAGGKSRNNGLYLSNYPGDADKIANRIQSGGLAEYRKVVREYGDKGRGILGT